jgi:hypothetical protein
MTDNSTSGHTPLICAPVSSVAGDASADADLLRYLQDHDADLADDPEFAGALLRLHDQHREVIKARAILDAAEDALDDLCEELAEIRLEARQRIAEAEQDAIEGMMQVARNIGAYRARVFFHGVEAVGPYVPILPRRSKPIP